MKITRICRTELIPVLQKWIKEMADADKILKSTKLPTLPAVAFKLLELSRNPDSEVADFVKAIKTDPAISAKILKTANSSFFCLRTKATSVERAVPLLGTNTVSTLALGFSLVESSSGTGPAALHYRNYWLQSVVQAIAAESLGQKVDKGMASEYFLTGLMLDLGQLAMLKAIPDEYHQLLERYNPDETELYLLEMAELGFSHVEIGTQLMQKWDLPDQVIEAVGQHHTDFSLLTEDMISKMPLLTRGGIFAAVAGDFFCKDSKGKSLQQLRQLAARYFGFDETWLDNFLMHVGGRIEESAQLFSADGSELCDPAELMAEANEQLAHMALMAQIATTQNLEQQMQTAQEFMNLESRNKELETQAITDPLTGAFNRRFFEETLKKEASRCQRYSLSAGVLFCDVDHFKEINDTYGHACGDEVLKAIAKVLNDAVRSSDTVSRYGGEEFVALLIGADQVGVAHVAERIRDSVAKMAFHFEGSPVKVTISVGGTVTTPLPGPPELLCKQLVEMADEAMYQAKQNGRNRVEFRDFTSVSSPA